MTLPAPIGPLTVTYRPGDPCPNHCTTAGPDPGPAVIEPLPAATGTAHYGELWCPVCGEFYGLNEEDMTSASEPEVFTGDRYTGEHDIGHLAKLIAHDLVVAELAGPFPPGHTFVVTIGRAIIVYVAGPDTPEVDAEVSRIANAYNKIVRPPYGERDAFYDLTIVHMTPGGQS